MLRRLSHLVYCSAVTILKFLIILPLSLRFTSEVRWDSKASTRMSRADACDVHFCFPLPPLSCIGPAVPMNRRGIPADPQRVGDTQSHGQHKVSTPHPALSRQGCCQPQEGTLFIPTRTSYRCRKKAQGY